MNNITAFFKKAEHDDEFREWTVAVSASVLLHIGLLVMIVVFTGHTTYREMPFRSIDVDMAMIPPPKGKAETPPAKSAKPEQKKKEQKVSKPASKPAAKPVEKKKDVTGLKQKKAAKKEKKEPKPQDVINDAIKRLEQDLAKNPAPQTDPIAERLKQIAKEARDEPKASDQPVGTESGTAKQGDSAYDVTLEQRYSQNVKLEIWENWAFSVNLAGGQDRLESWVAFEILPDGEIQNVRLVRKSGNDYMDSAATMAVVKSSPVIPHPPGLKKKYVEMVVKFIPKLVE